MQYIVEIFKCIFKTLQKFEHQRTNQPKDFKRLGISKSSYLNVLNAFLIRGGATEKLID